MALLFVVGAAGVCSVEGLSTDTKPTPTNLFTFYETDTGRSYLADGAQWNLISNPDYATAAQGATADSALQPAGNGGSLTGLTKTQVGLANVDNTSDAGKPISTATQTALDGKQVAGSYATGAQGALADAAQPGDAQLTSLATLTYAANTLKVVRVNAGETGFELATPAGGSVPETLQSNREPIADVSVAANYSVFADEEFVIADGFEVLLETNASLVIF